MNNFLDKEVLSKKAQGVLNSMGGGGGGAPFLFFIQFKGLRILSLELGGVCAPFLSLELGWVL